MEKPEMRVKEMLSRNENIKYLRKGEPEMKELKIRAEFIEELLGSANNDKEIHAEFIASKAPDAPSRRGD